MACIPDFGVHDIWHNYRLCPFGEYVAQTTRQMAQSYYYLDTRPLIHLKALPYKAGDEIRTLDTLLGKQIRYHRVTPALKLSMSENPLWPYSSLLVSLLIIRQ
jgi:hypothetical protein